MCELQLRDKVALVTGSSRGIGKAIALKLASEGADIILNALHEETLKEVACEIEILGRRVKTIIADVSKAQGVDELFKASLEFGKIDILVNNAGIAKDNLIIRMKEEEWDKVLEINLKSAFLCTRAAAKFMLKQKSGRIINITSVIGLIGNIGQVNYSASKAGLVGFTKSIAKELASRGITVNAVAPGFIQTDMTEKLPENIKKELISKIPLGFLGVAEDVANLVLFLSSPASRYITGQVINVDGGMLM
ncbi:MAG: 3-oxoacyl-[acyl-carrier-protein] reductase [Armatimonadetes bacterium]|nr:3-oxoacyl-[acyl-carrier-protein] reductase [Armatimonadota bacterium]